MATADDRIHQRHQNQSPPLKLQTIALYCTIGGSILSVIIAGLAVCLTFYVSNQSVKIDKMDTLLRKDDSLIAKLNILLDTTRAEKDSLAHLIKKSNDIFDELSRQLVTNKEVLKVGSTQLKLSTKQNQYEIRTNYFKLKDIVEAMPFARLEEINLGHPLSSSSELAWLKRTDTVITNLRVGISNPFLASDSVAYSLWQSLNKSAKQLGFTIRRIRDPKIAMAGTQMAYWKDIEKRQLRVFHNSFAELRTYFLKTLDEFYTK